ncbi:hypothetical protein L9F63_027554, partial [Diploptera punctata]
GSNADDCLFLKHVQTRVTFYMKIAISSNSLLGSGTDDEDDDDNSTSTTPGGTSSLKHHHTGSVHSGSTPEANNNSLAPGDMAPLVGGPGSLNDSKTGQDDSEDQGSLDGDPETRDSQTENKSPDDGNSGSKRRGPRTTIKAKQLEILKDSVFAKRRNQRDTSGNN